VVHRDAVGVLADRLHRRAEDEPVAEVGRQPLRDLLRAAGEPPVLGAAGDPEQLREAAGRVHVEEEVQQRQVLRLAREDGLHAEGEDLAGPLVLDLLLEPRLHGDGVPLGGERCLPRRVQRHLERHQVEVEHRRDGLGHRVRVAARDGAGVEVPVVAEPLDVVAGVVGREGLDAGPLGEREQLALGRAGPLAAVVDDEAVEHLLAQDPAADAVAGLEHLHARAGCGKGGRGRETGVPGTHHHDVDVGHPVSKM
jgi:hypothetical protein